MNDLAGHEMPAGFDMDQVSFDQHFDGMNDPFAGGPQTEQVAFAAF
jgi:hypothetical protein